MINIQRQEKSILMPRVREIPQYTIPIKLPFSFENIKDLTLQDKNLTKNFMFSAIIIIAMLWRRFNYVYSKKLKTFNASSVIHATTGVLDPTPTLATGDVTSRQISEDRFLVILKNDRFSEHLVKTRQFRHFYQSLDCYSADTKQLLQLQEQRHSQVTMQQILKNTREIAKLNEEGALVNITAHILSATSNRTS